MKTSSLNSRNKWVVIAFLTAIALGLFIQRGFAEDQINAPSEPDALCKEFIANGHAEGVKNYQEACGDLLPTFGSWNPAPLEPKVTQP